MFLYIPVRLARSLAYGQYPVVFGELGDHDDRRRPLLPDHRPEVVDCVRHRSLSSDVRTRFTAVALNTQPQRHWQQQDTIR